MTDSHIPCARAWFVSTRQRRKPSRGINLPPPTSVSRYSHITVEIEDRVASISDQCWNYAQRITTLGEVQIRPTRHDFRIFQLNALVETELYGRGSDLSCKRRLRRIKELHLGSR